LLTDASQTREQTAGGRLASTCPHQTTNGAHNRLNQTRQLKIRKYEDFDEGAEVQPVIFTPLSTLEVETYEMLKKLELSIGGQRGFARDFVAQAKIELIRFECYRRRALKTKARHQAWTNDETEE
jgi:hypothetical protein